MSRVEAQSHNHPGRRTAALILILACLSLSTRAMGQVGAANASQAKVDGGATQQLALGSTIERALKGGETHAYSIKLRRGEFLHVSVEQQGVNVIVTLSGRAGVKLIEADLLNEMGPEPLSYEAPEGGDYLLKIGAVAQGAPGGRYSITAALKPAATADDRTRAAAERLLFAAQQLYWMGDPAALRRAEAKSKEALALWRRLDDKYWVAYSLNKLGAICAALNRQQESFDFYSQALALRREIGDERGVASTLGNIAGFYDTAGNKREAIEHLRQALPHQRATGDRVSEAETLNSLGLLHTDLKEHQEALDSYRESHAIYESLGDQLGEAATLNNIGLAYFHLKEGEKALDYYTCALEIYKSHPNPDEGNTLTNLGDLYAARGEWPRALDFYGRALARRRAASDRVAEALANVGDSHYAQGEWRKALGNYNEALVLRRAERDAATQAYLLGGIGSAREKLGDWAPAVGAYEQALKLFRVARNAEGEARALKSLGDAFYARDKRRAVDYYTQLAPLQHAAGDARAEANTYRNIGLLRGQLDDWTGSLVHLNKALAIYKGIGDRSRVAGTFTDLGNVYVNRFEYQKALDAYGEAAATFKEIADQLGEADGLYDLGWVYSLLNERGKSLEHYNRSLPLYEAHVGGGEGGSVLTAIGNIYVAREEWAKARDYFLQATAASRGPGASALRGEAFAQAGFASYKLGERQKALTYYNQSLEAFRAGANLAGQARAVSSIAWTHDQAGEWRQAVREYEQALWLYREARDVAGEAGALKSLGDALDWRGERRAALGYYEQLLRLRRAAGNRSGEAIVLTSMAFVHQNLGDARRALSYMGQAVAVARADGSRVTEADALSNLGTLYYRQNDDRKALEYYERALALYKAANHRWGEGTTLNYIGLTYDLLGDPRRALDYYKQSLQIAREVGSLSTEADTLVNMGLIYAGLGDQQQALGLYRQALALRHKLGDAKGEADALTNIGASYNSLGDNKNALASFEEALGLRRGAGDRDGEANALMQLAGLHWTLGETEKVAEELQQALPIFRSNGDAQSEAVVLIGLATIDIMLERYAEARTYLDQGRNVFRAIGNRKVEGVTLLLAGAASYELHEPRRALAEFQQSLRLLKTEQVPIVQGGALYGLGNAYDQLGERRVALKYYREALTLLKDAGNVGLVADTLKEIGGELAALGRDAEALDTYLQSLAQYRAAGQPSGEAAILKNIGDIYAKQGDQQKAKSYYAQAIVRFSDAGGTKDNAAPPEAKTPPDATAGTYDSLRERKGAGVLGGEREEYTRVYFRRLQEARAGGKIGFEAEALSDMMGALRADEPEMAIIFGKQSVERFQQILAEADQHDWVFARNTYLRHYKDTYHDLAELLMEAGRLSEAEHVLDMLKEGEYLAYVRRDSGEVDALRRRPDLSPEERKVFAEYLRIFNQIAAIGERQAELKARKRSLPAGTQMSGAEAAELEQCNQDMTAATLGLEALLKRVRSEFADAKTDVAARIKEHQAMQDRLQQWGEGTVLLYTFAGRDRYRITLTTQSAQYPGKYDIPAAELSRKIADFRRAVGTPEADPRPLGRELYDILVKPVEEQLEQAHAKTLLWVLDGPLRYVPMPALYDGSRYMVERYQQVMLTPVSYPRLSDAVHNDWRGLGLGVSVPRDTFPALPAVASELEEIIREDGAAITTGGGAAVGLIPGRRLLNEQFTARAFAEELGRSFTLVHVATHFKLTPGDDEKSFLLLGDGGRLSLKTLRTDAGYDFKGVELLTLSACDTGVPGGGLGAEGDGDEVENFAVLAQNKGAKAVIATLWQVVDGGTRDLMREFYRVHCAGPDVTKSEALRQAQLVMLRGKAGASGEAAGAARADVVGLGAQKFAGAPFPHDPGRPYAHPYYWAPFVLIGNWR